MSLFSSGDFGLVEVRGRIQFSLVYDSQKEELQVRVYRCEDIASARKARSDPWVCVRELQQERDVLYETSLCVCARLSQIR